MSSSVTTPQVNSRPLGSVPLSPADAGAVIAFVGGDPTAVHLYAKTRSKDPKVARIQPVNGKYRLPSPLPVDDSYFLTAVKPGEDGRLEAKFKVAAAKPAKDADPVVVPPLDEVATSAGLQPWPRFGACFKFSDDPKWVKRGQSIGVTHFRSFGETVPAGGRIPEKAFAAQKTILDACPGATLVGCHGPSEGSSTAPTADDYARFCAAFRPKMNGYEGRYVWELPNEVNASNYLSLNQAGSKLSSDVVKLVIAYAMAAREELGPDIYIVGPSIGYDANSAIHIDYAKAFEAEGLLELIDAYNDHLYPQGGVSQLIDQIAGIRGVIGNRKAFWSTETSWKYLPKGDWPAKAPTLARVEQNADILPFAYRLLPRGDSKMDDRSLLKADGSVDSVITSAWGLKAAS